MKKVGIMTIHSLNLGNRLQNYALQTVLERCGADVYTIKRANRNESGPYYGKAANFLRSAAGTRAGLYLRFDRNYIRFGEYSASPDKIQKGLEDEYDIYVAGSDQVWNPFFDETTGASDLLMFDTKGKKVSYAASFGIDNLPDDKKELYSKALSDFDAISVREKTGADIVKDLIGKEPEVVLDPTLLLDSNEWQKIMKRPGCAPKKDFALLYFLGGNDDPRLEQTIRTLESEQNLICFDVLKKNRWNRKPALGPSEFLWLLFHAKMVLTDSFHATVFSAIFHTPVRTYKRIGMDMNSRIVNLAETLGVERCFDEEGTLLLDDTSIYEVMDESLRDSKERSMEYLRKALEDSEMRAIRIERRTDCCGCGACSAACPKQCIRMKEDREGFLYPSVDRAECINCGQCRRVCPIICSARKGMEAAQDTQIAYVKDEDIRLTSSSGGIFTALASEVIGNGGVVFGAAFDSDFMVYHKAVETMEELSELRGSKYLQSRTEDTFRQAKEALDAGRAVLYSGTGCQIAGLRAFLKKDYDNLVTVDVICHGVPSPKLWKKYKKELEESNGAKVSGVNFRKKIHGWKSYSVTVDFENGNQYENIFSSDPFMKMFLSNICLRPSCHACRFKAVNSQADITIGDCWEIVKYMPEFDDDKGITEIHVHTEKGKELIAKISDNIIAREAECDQIAQPMFDHSVSPHIRRRQFFEDLVSGKSIGELAKLVPINRIDRVAGKIKRIFRR